MISIQYQFFKVCFILVSHFVLRTGLQYPIRRFKISQSLEGWKPMLDFLIYSKIPLVNLRLTFYRISKQLSGVHDRKCEMGVLAFGLIAGINVTNVVIHKSMRGPLYDNPNSGWQGTISAFHQTNTFKLRQNHRHFKDGISKFISCSKSRVFWFKFYCNWFSTFQVKIGQHWLKPRIRGLFHNS